jgi:tRNA pseudouridine13 synthase
LKDRNAVTTQWFSVNLSGKPEADWSPLDTDDVRMLRARRHRRKLKRGAHSANRFVITLRDVQCDRAELEHRLRIVARDGVPNYFGEQRFGVEAGNVERAHAMLAGESDVKDRHQRGIYLSAARSHLFNIVLSRRVADGTWNQALSGDAFVLEGTHSFFVEEAIDDTIRRRIADGDIHPSGPLWGKGDLPARGAVCALERNVLEQFAVLRDGLERAGMAQERRALRLRVPDLAWEFVDDHVLRLMFTLPPGAYATTVLREIVRTN